jgi:hypothetical protein
VLPGGSGTPVRGRVLSAAGSPIAGALIETDPLSSQPVWSHSDGSYELSIPPGSYRFRVSSDAGATPGEGFVVEVGREPVARDLVLADGGRIVGSVKDPSGQGVANVQVVVDTRDSGEWHTNSDGTFQIENILPRDYRVAVYPNGGDYQHTTVTVRAHETSHVTFTVEGRHGVLRGVVVDSNGQPAKDTFVKASREHEGGASDVEVGNVLVGYDGTFAISDIPEGTYTVSASDGATTGRLPHVKTGDSVRVQLHSTGSVAGVVRRGSVGVKNLHLALRNVQTGSVTDERFYETDGRYRIANVPPGSYVLTASDGESDAKAPVNVVEAQVSQLDVSLDGGLTLTGRILDVVSKRPIPDLKTSVAVKGGFGTHQGTTDADGRFAIAGIPAGAIELFVNGADYWGLHESREVDASTSDFGDLYAVKNRTTNFETGRIGVRFAEDALRVTEIDPTGPAANSGLLVGDVVTSIDGTDVTNVGFQTARTLLFVSPGTPVQLGLSRGVTLTIVEGPRH